MGQIEQFTSPDGTIIACHTAGQGRPLVLVHGMSAGHTRWSRVIDALNANFKTYAVDRRGRGASTDSSHYAVEREFDDVATVVAGIGGEVDLLGHSYGGLCSLEAALRTRAVRKLVLYEPPLPVTDDLYPRGFIERLARMLDAGDREGVVSTLFGEALGMPSDELERLRGDAGWRGRVAAANTIPREMRSAGHYRPDFARYATLRVPTLLLVGGDSAPPLVEATRHLHEAIVGSHLAVIPGQQHVAMDTAPDLFLVEILGFLD